MEVMRTAYAKSEIRSQHVSNGTWGKRSRKAREYRERKARIVCEGHFSISLSRVIPPACCDCDRKMCWDSSPLVRLLARRSISGKRWVVRTFFPQFVVSSAVVSASIKSADWRNLPRSFAFAPFLQSVGRISTTGFSLQGTHYKRFKLPMPQQNSSPVRASFCLPERRCNTVKGFSRNCNAITRVSLVYKHGRLCETFLEGSRKLE